MMVVTPMWSGPTCPVLGLDQLQDEGQSVELLGAQLPGVHPIALQHPGNALL